MEEAGDPCELSPVHYLQEKKKRGKERRKREKNKRIKNNLYLSIAPFINLRFDISACIYISLSQLLVDKTTELRPFVHHVPRFENIGGGGGGGGGFVIGIVRWWKGTEDTRDSHGAGRARTREREPPRKAAAWIVVASKTSRIRSIVPRRGLQLGVYARRRRRRRRHMGRQMARTHQRCVSRYRKTPSTYPFRVDDAANTSDGRRLNFRTVRTGC